jgi:predicted nuclease of restriction endonuclease-like (RecB) superfamily
MEKEYVELIAEMRQSIIRSRYVAAKLVNKEQLMLYLKIGWVLSVKIAARKWGAKVLERIAEDLQKQLPGLRGFSPRNLWYMKKFYEVYEESAIMQSVTAEIRKVRRKKGVIAASEYFWAISFTHHTLLLDKCKTNDERLFYIEQAAIQFWPVRTLKHHLDANLFDLRGTLPNNFERVLSENLKTNALEVFKDEYLFDFVGSEDGDEKVLEGKLVADIKNMIMTLGKGFCFIGNQYRLEVEGEEFFVDLLFFNRHLRCLVAFELKRGKFMPAYAGQLNFYLNVLDEKIRLENENPSIGIILCKEKKNTVVEFAVKSIDKAMGVATYRTTKEMPSQMKGILPDVREMVKLL